MDDKLQETLRRAQDLIEKPVLVSEDWGRLAEIARRASICRDIRSKTFNFQIKLVSDLAGVDGCLLSLLISPHPRDYKHLEIERELEQFIQKFEILAAYISGLDDALPGEIEE